MSIPLKEPPTFMLKKPKLITMLVHITKDYVKVLDLVDSFLCQVIACNVEGLGSYKFLPLKLARKMQPLIFLMR